MPKLPLKPCAGSGCPALVVRGRCPRCQQAYDLAHPRFGPEPIRGSRHARGYGYAWTKLRAEHLRLEPFCRRCRAQGIQTPATDVDHIVPRSRGGSDQHYNLQSLCHTHHSRKTYRETPQGARRMQP